MDFITAYKHLTQSLSRNDCTHLTTHFKDLEKACLEDQLYLSAEICNLMTSSHTEKSRSAWKMLLDLCAQELDADDFYVQIPYMANQKKWWLIEEALNQGVPLDTSNPNIFKSLIACAPLEKIQEIISQHEKEMHPEDAVLSVCNPDQRVFDYFLKTLSTQTMQQALQQNSEGVRVSGVRFPITVHPWVTSALEKKVITENVQSAPNCMERSPPSRRM